MTLGGVVWGPDAETAGGGGDNTDPLRTAEGRVFREGCESSFKKISNSNGEETRLVGWFAIGWGEFWVFDVSGSG